MERPLEETAAALERLAAEVRDLERRVCALETGHELRGASASPGAAAVAAPAEPAMAVSGGAVPVVGKAILGIAGAYLLRAAADAGTLPRLAAVGLALAYAAVWLFCSVRRRAPNDIAGPTYGITAALILSPMLWETTVRYQVLPPAATATLLALFVVLASALAWARDLGAVVSVATISAAVTAVALVVATHDLVPFAAALLAMGLVIESGACRGHWLRVRWVVAAAADFTLALLLYIQTRPQGVPPGYKPAAPATLLGLAAALLAVYGGSVVYRSVMLRREMSVFEVWQAAAAFLISIAACLRIGQAAAVLPTGLFCLTAAAACYLTAFGRLETGTPHRNYHAFASYALALSMWGTWLLLPRLPLVTAWCAGALIATAAATAGRRTPGFHGLAYLWAAALASGMLDYDRHAMAGPFPAGARGAVYIAALAAALCYAAWWRKGVWEWCRAPRLLSASLAVFALAGLAVAALGSIAARGDGLTPPVLATVRMLVTCAAALALGFAGSRSKRPELVWLAYAAIAFGTLKLLFEDFRHGRPAAFAFSLLCYGCVLILVPRLVRRAGAEAAQPAP